MEYWLSLFCWAPNIILRNPSECRTCFFELLALTKSKIPSNALNIFICVLIYNSRKIVSFAFCNLAICIIISEEDTKWMVYNMKVLYNKWHEWKSKCYIILFQSSEPELVSYDIGLYIKRKSSPIGFWQCHLIIYYFRC